MNNPSTPLWPTTRREFLRLGGSGLGLVAFSAFAPRFLTQAAAANLPAPQKDKRILVLVQLAGGNDGLNTVVPYTDDLYLKLRPNLGIKDVKSLHKLDGHLALAPTMGDVAELAHEGKFAVVQNVGYPNPNRSHFRSSEIWETASDADAYLQDGWVGRYIDNCCAGSPKADAATTHAPTQDSDDPEAVHSGTVMPQTLSSIHPRNYFSIGGNARAQDRPHPRRDGSTYVPLLDEFAHAPAPNDEGSFLSHTLMDALITEKRVQKILDAYQTNTQYPNNQLAQSLKRVAALIASGMETRVYFCTLGGFDTHANQFNNHQRLLGDLSSSLAAFQKDLEAHGLDKQVLTMTFSEFGRRPYENSALGTDHGTAAPLFVMGSALKTESSVIGNAPDLNIPKQGDIQYKIDFRQIYSTILHNWLETDPKLVLGKKFEELQLV